MSKQLIPYENIRGTDNIPAFIGLVSVQDDGNYVINFGEEHVNIGEGSEVEIFKFDQPKTFYSPYSDEVDSVEVVGELRTINYQEPLDTMVLFGYTKPNGLTRVTYAGPYESSETYLFSSYGGVNYRLHAELDWNTPLEPLTPADYVRLEMFDNPHTIKDGEFAGTVVHGNMVDNRFGRSIEMPDDLPEDFDSYLECNTCENYSEHHLHCV